MQTINVLMTKFSKGLILSALMTFMFLGLSADVSAQINNGGNNGIPLKKRNGGHDYPCLEAGTHHLTFNNDYGFDLYNVSLSVSTTGSATGFSYNYFNSGNHIPSGGVAGLTVNVPPNFNHSIQIIFTFYSEEGKIYQSIFSFCTDSLDD